MVRFSVAAVCAAALVAVDAMGDFVLITNSGATERYSDAGEPLDPLFRIGVDHPGEIPDDDLLETIGNGPNGSLFVSSLAWGSQTIELHRFSPSDGALAGPLYSNPTSSIHWIANRPQPSDPCPINRDACSVIPEFTGRMDWNVTPDEAGTIWSIGAVDGLSYGGRAGNILQSETYGWGISRFVPGADQPPEAILQATSGTTGSGFSSQPLREIAIRPSDGRVFLSTDFGLLEFGSDDIPTLLEPGPWTPERAQIVTDTTNPASPFHAGQPWMHPDATGARWAFGPNELLWNPGQSRNAPPFFVRYDPATREFADPFLLPGLTPQDSVTDWFYDDSGNLLVLVDGQVRPFECEDPNSQLCGATWVNQRLMEYDVGSGELTRVVFDVERLQEARSGGLNGARMIGGVYLTLIPEPSPLLLAALPLALLAAPRRGANLAAR